jgi:CRISPR-associated endonuclease/helicase Cas3
MGGFVEFVRWATGDAYGPYRYQERLAEEGLPDLLCVPTAAGKTLAATLPWLYRRRSHPDPAVRKATPRRLVLVLPQRSLVEQTYGAVRGWLGRLGERSPDLPGGGGWPPVGLHLLLGGASSDDREWKLAPDQDAILVGTQDMVLSRLLLRGYGESRAGWPISFGLLHADTQFVFDEVQLMGPALPTSLQLTGLRRHLGTAAPCGSMWMSATVDLARLEAPDFTGIGSRVGLTGEDRAGALARRLDATRVVKRLDAEPKRYATSLAEAVTAGHVPGTRTIVVLNTVDRATQVYDAILRTRPAACVVLLHSRFRPRDRNAHLAEALDQPAGAGTIVVSTQVLEAGVDVSSRLLVTEVAPWSSVVQRAGRCNRAGDDPGARLMWVSPPPSRNSAAPYDGKDLARSAEALTALESEGVTSTRLQEQAVEEERPVYPMLRRRDLLDLFDTSADLSGNDLDVGQWIRDADAITASVAWRAYGKDGPPDDAPAPNRDELCPVPLGELRDQLPARREQLPARRAWVFDQRDGGWNRAEKADVRPTAVIVLDAAQGGYTEDRGWSPTATRPVPPVEPEELAPPDSLPADLLSSVGEPVSLAQHLADVGHEVRALLDAFGGGLDLSIAQREAAERAGLLHDLGKAHGVFVASLARLGVPAQGGPWAKSGSRGRLQHTRPAFRHELVSALMVLHPQSGLLDGVAEPDLVAYLVAAHHGKVRLAARSVPADGPDEVLGVGRQEPVGAVRLPDGRVVPELTLHREALEVGDGGLGESWTARACRLRDRPDLGPFRLAFLEAVVRAADWRVSRSYEGT